MYVPLPFRARFAAFFLPPFAPSSSLDEFGESDSDSTAGIDQIPMNHVHNEYTPIFFRTRFLFALLPFSLEASSSLGKFEAASNPRQVCS